MTATNDTAPPKLIVRGIPTEHAQALRRGGPDAHGQPPIAAVARGAGNPCRHCLQLIADGDTKLVLAYRPFGVPQPYAETGPVFLHQTACARYDADALPAWFAHLTPALVRGYDANDWIVYETGRVVAGTELAEACHAILARDDVAYVHIRSRFNCFQCRVERG
ncbi:DUF1203 domain-containing protein [Pelomonas cellulosilytica]|uniref:DUF1203 domain-containing protein n=1 Tax=Pelomonas cellulosilytica TaxID=2906762 RepID=A0ABS8XLY3_9BURK|nr:DUF1203 domain-containing protein [Pelomonas sp. P8]MCE4553794.1 DUF1203 domain-containing protein [Pelomonas sp. P8]